MTKPPRLQFVDEVLGIVREGSPGVFSCRVTTASGAARGVLRIGKGHAPTPAQLSLMRWAILEADKLKRLAVAFVRNEVLTRPDRYGLLEQDGRPAEWAAPYFQMSEAEYFDDFRLELLEVEGHAPGYIYMTCATDLDPEHGVPVLFREGKPVEAFA